MSLEVSPEVSGELSAAEHVLIQASLALSERLDVAQTCEAMLGVVERVCGARSTWILLHDAATDELVTTAFRGPGADSYANARIACDRGIVGLVFRRREALFVGNAQSEDRWFDSERVRRSELRAVLTLPIGIGSQAIGVIGLDSPCFSAKVPPSKSSVARLQAIATIAAAEIRNARQVEAIDAERVRLLGLLQERGPRPGEVPTTQKPLQTPLSLNGAVGESPAFREVLSKVALVAPVDTTVLLLGETGTGKELIARALHDQSPRSAKPFIAVNCAALPESLVESELFGYEKGAFTGAVSRKPGLFELANQGTLFLDEVGDLRGRAQAKLLRVLQEREVQRVGGTRAESVNVRLIAATNQDLAEGVHSGRFRADLFYRLNVFPIPLPPLRERREDIAALAQHFAERFADRHHRPPPQLTREALDRLVEYSWPGNVRELQNVIERSVILSVDSVIAAGSLALQPDPDPDPAPADVSAKPQPAGPQARATRFCDAERHAIQRALELSAWRISGPAGAAEILGLKPTTLHGKMKRLGITRHLPRIM